MHKIHGTHRELWVSKPRLHMEEKVKVLVSQSCSTLFNPMDCSPRASQVAQTIKNLLAMRETLIWSLGQEDPLVKGMTTHSSILAWRIPWTEDLGGPQSMGSQRVGHNWATNTFFFFFFSPEAKGCVCFAGKIQNQLISIIPPKLPSNHNNRGDLEQICCPTV